MNFFLAIDNWHFRFDIDGNLERAVYKGMKRKVTPALNDKVWSRYYREIAKEREKIEVVEEIEGDYYSSTPEKYR